VGVGAFTSLLAAEIAAQTGDFAARRLVSARRTQCCG